MTSRRGTEGSSATAVAGWDALLRVDRAMRMVDDEVEDVEAAMTDLADRLSGVARIAVHVQEPAHADRNERPVLEARVPGTLGVAEAVAIARDAYLCCLASANGESTNGNPPCEASTIEFARGAETRLRELDGSGVIAIDRLEATANVYISYMGWWEGCAPALVDGLLTMTPSIGS